MDEERIMQYLRSIHGDLCAIASHTVNVCSDYCPLLSTDENGYFNCECIVYDSVEDYAEILARMAHKVQEARG